MQFKQIFLALVIFFLLGNIFTVMCTGDPGIFGENNTNYVFTPNFCSMLAPENTTEHLDGSTNLFIGSLLEELGANHVNNVKKADGQKNEMGKNKVFISSKINNNNNPSPLDVPDDYFWSCDFSTFDGDSDGDDDSIMAEFDVDTDEDSDYVTVSGYLLDYNDSIIDGPVNISYWVYDWESDYEYLNLTMLYNGSAGQDYYYVVLFLFDSNNESDDYWISDYYLLPYYYYENVYVDDDADPSWYNASNVRTIQEGIDNASAGGIVYVYNGTYYENVDIDKTISLIGENRNTTIIDGSGSGDVVYVHFSADYVNISGFSIQDSGEDYSGIQIESDYNNISNNVIKNNNYSLGVYLDYSTDNNLVENEFINNSIFLIGENLSDFIHNIENNTVNEKPLYYYKNEQSSFAVPSDAGAVILVNCTNATVRDENISHVSTGIEIYYSQNITITNNSITNSFCGILLCYSDYSNLSFNNVSISYIGLLLVYSDYNLIKGNNISYNLFIGLFIEFCGNNTIVANDIGINFFGLGLAYSNNNSIYHNNFMNNFVHAADDGSNLWCDATYSEGNYWDDYIGSDYNGDGIGDTPYDIPGGSNQDLYPLMYERTSPPIFVWVNKDFNASVPGWGEDHFNTIQQGIDNTSLNGIVYVNNGTYYENVVVDKTLTIIGEDKNTTILDGCGDVGFNITSNNTFINGFTINNCTFGISLLYNSFEASNITISNNTIYNCGHGILLVNSNNTYILSNTIFNNLGNSLFIETCNNSHISNNVFYNNSQNGITIKNSSNCNIFSNNIHNNSDLGISIIDPSQNNSIFKNNINNNSDKGIYVSEFSSNNSFYHNNFINNAQNANDTSNNTWYNTTLLEGNYWDDFDEPSEGAYDNNSDGISDGLIVDTPYNISGDSNQDLYPLTGPWGERPNKPNSNDPYDGATGVSTSPTLKVSATDPNNDTMSISFYTSGGSLIGTDTNVASGDNASVTWSGRSYSTPYGWYAVANDSKYLTKSETWSFTTQQGSSSPPPGGPEGPTNTAPTADAGGLYTGYVNQPVTFTGSGTPYSGRTITSYTWNFGDETTGNGSTTIHTYTKSGTYTVKLTVTDNVGENGSDTTKVTINSQISIESSNKTLEEIEEKYGITLEKPFYANDTNGDGVIDTFTDPNGILTNVNYVNISGHASFLISVDDNEIPEFFWDTTTNTITSVAHATAQTTTEPIINTKKETITIEITVNKTGWIYIDITDQYPDYILTVKTSDNRTIPTDKMWRKDGKIYVLDDPDTIYDFIYGYTIIAPTFNPTTETTFDTSKPTITITYQEQVTITTALFGTNDITDQITNTDSMIFTFTAGSDLDDGTYTLSITAVDGKGNTLTSTATYTIKTEPIVTPTGEFPWLLLIIGLIILIVIIIALLYLAGYIRIEKEHTKEQPSWEQKPKEQQSNEQTSEEQQSFDNFKN